jgi:hypothetical protein
VFFIVLSSSDDSKLLDDTLKVEYRASRHEGTIEYPELEDLKHLFKELHARNVLRRMKERIVQILQELSRKGVGG